MLCDARLWQCRKHSNIYRCVIALKSRAIGSRTWAWNGKLWRNQLFYQCSQCFETSGEQASKHEMLWAKYVCVGYIFFSRFVTVSYIKCAQKSRLSRVSWFMSQFSGFIGNEKNIKSAISFSNTFFSRSHSLYANLNFLFQLSPSTISSLSCSWIFW